MKKTTQFLIVTVALLCSTVIMSQSTVTGTVVGAATNMPLLGANLTEKVTTNGVTTDFDGNFSFESSTTSGNVLVSFVGYESKTIAFNGTTNFGSVALKPSAESLEEIIITATSFAIDRKTPVAVSTVKADVSELKTIAQVEPQIKRLASANENDRLCNVFTKKVKTYESTMRDDSLAEATLVSYKQRMSAYCDASSVRS